MVTVDNTIYLDLEFQNSNLTVNADLPGIIRALTAKHLMDI